MMLLVSGCTATVSALAPHHPGRLGHLLTPANGNSPAAIADTGLPFACDNGCFGGLDAAAFRRMLSRVAGLPRCLWVVVPDVVADARATLALFAAWRDEVAAAGHPLALVAQDGQESLPVPWADIGCLFLGGSTAWKLSPHAARLTAEAKARGKLVHMGRVNSRRRLALAASWGVDSIDGGSLSMFGDTHIPRFLRWAAHAEAQPSLFWR